MIDLCQYDSDLSTLPALTYANDNVILQVCACRYLILMEGLELKAVLSKLFGAPIANRCVTVIITHIKKRKIIDVLHDKLFKHVQRSFL